mmetsp:Transcript_11829/g.15026  ORF Transcript_11829/g.15026 Transcript_11829/m.15026 type:complete len:84 (+) Transcript_11829:155-406(+)
MDTEFKCPICRSILVQPMFTPCGHVFCSRCLKNQINREKQGGKLTSCAKCKLPFSHRNLREFKHFNRMLAVWCTLRTANDLCT